MLMKLKVTVVAIIAALCVFGFYVLQPEEKKTKEQAILEYVFASTKNYHYLDVKIDDGFSEKAYKQYLKTIDRSKRVLLASDIEQLSKYTHSIDDEINNAGALDFYNEAQAIINKREKEIEPVFKDILSKPFDFSITESVETEEEKRDFPANDLERKELWRKLLKYQVLSRYYNLKEKIETDSAKTEKSDVELEKEAREKVLKSYEEWSKSLKQVDATEQFSLYVNALMSVYDPHTNYFAPVEKKDFDIHMTGRLEGIGATLQEKDGYVKVTAIVPGSASWKQGELEAGDLILEVAQGADKPVDVADMRLDKVVGMIRGPKGTEVRLTVKKVEGTTKIIPIIRDVVVLEETFAKSAILTRDGDNTKYGYINLPSFYADFTGEGGRNSATDVMKEVERLSVNDIAGTVIDLRNNGGGSLQDAIQMIGIFIESGPVVIVDDKAGSSHAYKDPNPGIQDTKPLVVLVNGFSASASEIFAAAIQDYHRGVIMGTESTFGKGSVQRFYELSQFKSALNQSIDDDDLGSVKITQSKFFRINGGATQLSGVVPDIIMPDLYSGIKQGEREEDYPMPWTKIKKAKYAVYKSEPHYKELQTAAKMRVDTTSYFKLLNAHLELVRKEEKKTLQSLKYSDYERDMKDLKASSKRMEKAIKGLKSVHTDYLKDEKAKIESDKALKERLSGFHKTLLNDEYIYQALITLGQMK